MRPASSLRAADDLGAVDVALLDGRPVLWRVKLEAELDGARWDRTASLAVRRAARTLREHLACFDRWFDRCVIRVAPIGTFGRMMDELRVPERNAAIAVRRNRERRLSERHTLNAFAVLRRKMITIMSEEAWR